MIRRHLSLGFACLLTAAACGDGSSNGEVHPKGQRHADASTPASGDTDAGTEHQPPAHTDSDGGSPTTSDAQLAKDAVAKLKQCNLYVPSNNILDDQIEDEFDRCSAHCVLDVSCADAKVAFCSDTPPAGNALIRCADNCSITPADGFVCKDGGKVPHAFVCDGEGDCKDGSDELNCGSHTCANGEMVQPADVVCDGYADCSDGSDEANCPNICG